MVAAMQCPVCMVYGREDPWVVPLWGQRLKRLLADAVYLEVRPPAQSLSWLVLWNIKTTCVTANPIIVQAALRQEQDSCSVTLWLGQILDW